LSTLLPAVVAILTYEAQLAWQARSSKL